MCRCTVRYRDLSNEQSVDAKGTGVVSRVCCRNSMPMPCYRLICRTSSDSGVSRSELNDDRLLCRRENGAARVARPHGGVACDMSGAPLGDTLWGQLVDRGQRAGSSFSGQRALPEMGGGLHLHLDSRRVALKATFIDLFSRRAIG